MKIRPIVLTLAIALALGAAERIGEVNFTVRKTLVGAHREVGQR